MSKIDPKTVNKRLEQVLTDIRKSAGLTQIDVAKRLKKPQSFISKYETGERKLTVGDFLAVCEVFGVDASKVLGKVK